MPTDYKSAFGKTTTTSSTERKPTLNQWLRKLGKTKMAQQYLVMLIWTPGEFDNFTLETEKFRVILRNGHELYSALDAFTSDSATAEQGLAIVVDERRDGKFSIVESDEPGGWEEVGANGQKWKA